MKEATSYQQATPVISSQQGRKAAGSRRGCASLVTAEATGSGSAAAVASGLINNVLERIILILRRGAGC